MVDGIVKVVAFTNSKGGTIILGVDERVVGASLGRDTTKRLVNAIANSADPGIYPKDVQAGGRNFIEVGEGFEKPNLYKGRAYKRAGRSNVQPLKLHGWPSRKGKHSISGVLRPCPKYLSLVHWHILKI